MTPSELEQAARERYNAVGETFWSASEMYTLIYGACVELATKTLCIERTYTTTTVAGTAEYAFPTNVIALRRVTYDGLGLNPVDQVEGEYMGQSNSVLTLQGVPTGYEQWNSTITLVNTPNDAKTLKLYTYNLPQWITVTSTLEVPEFSHHRIINYMLSEMYAKDKDFASAKYYKDIWDNTDIPEVLRLVKKRKRADKPAHVKPEELMRGVGYL